MKIKNLIIQEYLLRIILLAIVYYVNINYSTGNFVLITNILIAVGFIFESYNKIKEYRKFN